MYLSTTPKVLKSLHKYIQATFRIQVKEQKTPLHCVGTSKVTGKPKKTDDGFLKRLCASLKGALL